MPCRMDAIFFNHSAQNDALQQVGDQITKELDMIREQVLNGQTPDFSGFSIEWADVIDDAEEKMRQERSGPSTGQLVSPTLFDKVTSLYRDYDLIKTAWRKDRCDSIISSMIDSQINHRKEDLRRLAHVFIDMDDRERLKAVLDADPELPLLDQLGFDPDEF